MLKKFQILLFVLLYAGVLLAQNAQQVERAFTFQKYDEAKKTALTWIEKEPKNPDAYYVTGKLYSKLGLVDSAESFFQAGLKADEDFAYNYIGKIRIAYHRGKLSDVAALVEEATDHRKSKKDQRWFLEMADACLLAPMENNPLETYTADAIKLDRKNALIYMILGEYYSLQSNATEANQNYQKALDYDKTMLKAYVERGSVYEKVRNYSEADIQYRKAIEIDAAFAPAYGNLAEMYYGNKDYQKAIEYYKQFIKYSEKSTLTQRKLANYLYMGKEYDTALEILLPLAEASPKDPYYLRLIAYSYTELNDSVKAAEKFRDYFAVVEKDKASFGDYSRYGRILVRLGDENGAIENLKAAYAMDTTKYDLLSDIGKLYKKQRRWKDVISVLEPKIQFGGNSVETLDYIDLGMACYFDSSYQKSKEVFEKFITIKPKLYIGYLWLSRVQVAMDPESKEWLAKPTYEKLFEFNLDPTKFKVDLVAANAYLASYYFFEYLNAQSAKDNAKSKSAFDTCVSYWKKVKELEPENPQFLRVQKEKIFKDALK